MTGHDVDDPLHGAVLVGPTEERCPVALHRAVGGDSDAPVSGDILCAALASCLDTTIRAVADRLRVGLTRLAVTVTAEVDVRGTLLVDASVPVGFQRINVNVDLALSDDAPASAASTLLGLAEHSCVVLDTLRKGVDVRMKPPRADARVA